MFSPYTDQIVKQEQLADLNRQAAHNQLVQQALDVQANRDTDVVLAGKKVMAKLTHNLLSAVFHLA